MSAPGHGAPRGYELPVTLTVGGAEYEIRSDFRAVLDVLAAVNDPDLDEGEKSSVMLEIIYPGWRTIPKEHIAEALDAACGFIDCGVGAVPEGGVPGAGVRLFDWEGDAAMIVAAVNGVAHTEVRALPYLHWWTFWGYFLEIGDCLFSTVLGIRHKRAKHKKLDEHEREFYRENRMLVDGRPRISAEDSAKMEEILKWLE